MGDKFLPSFVDDEEASTDEDEAVLWRVSRMEQSSRTILEEGSGRFSAGTNSPSRMNSEATLVTCASVTKGDEGSEDAESEVEELKLKHALPGVVQLPEEMWEELVEICTDCWRKGCASKKSDNIALFAEVGDSFGCLPLGPREDPDVAFNQLMKDIKRETVLVNEIEYSGAASFDKLYVALEDIVRAHNPDETGVRLENRVQRILRGCNRTVSGYDSYEIVSSLMGKAESPKALVTPAMMDNSPIRMVTEDDSVLVVSSVNVYKVSRELEDGSLATVVMFKTELTERIELDSWHSVRWMSLKPFDKAEECMNPIVLFRDRTFASLLKQTSSSEMSSEAEKESIKAILALFMEAKTSLDRAIEQSIKSVKHTASTEYQRGRQDALSERRRSMLSLAAKALEKVENSPSPV
uniref:Uncharacterized protein n=1 Tax=Mucochytrium quahogii TaxID=96639 RepID=A0A7S2WML3_9STRA|mmetsp:Transcript_10683/g.17450  ORF Transcript_10683/g.17450 Transcript_10683/m.17450 type:complete len:410 (-) Transcript_10683:3821-5050(-)